MIYEIITGDGPLTADDFALIKLRDTVENICEHFGVNSVTSNATDRLTTILRNKLTSYSNSTRLFMEISGRTQATLSDVKASLMHHKIDLKGFEGYLKYAHTERSETLPIFPVADPDKMNSENAYFKTIYGAKPSDEELKTRPEHIPQYYRAIHPEWIKDEFNTASKPVPRRKIKPKESNAVNLNIPNFAELSFSGFFEELDENRKFEDERRKAKVSPRSSENETILKPFFQKDTFIVKTAKSVKTAKKNTGEKPEDKSQKLHSLREQQINLPSATSLQQEVPFLLSDAPIDAAIVAEFDVEQKENGNQKRDEDIAQYKEYKRLKKERKRMRREERNKENSVRTFVNDKLEEQKSEELEEITNVTEIDESDKGQSRKSKLDESTEEYKEYKRLKKERKRREREEKFIETLEKAPPIPKLTLKIKFGNELFEKPIEHVPDTSFPPSITPLKIRIKNLLPAKKIDENNEKRPDKENCDESYLNQKQFHEDSDTGGKVWYCPVCSVVYANDKYMVGCDKCEHWFHWDCVGLTAEPSDSKWYCPRCINKKKTKKNKKRKASGVGGFNEVVKKQKI
ncbi:hypothetical protein GCK72_008114 [Caenorhabditis remanei]|uniref:PHD-type domain-containing protein n=1 Tax=Caenorhabditis remanei TaxID=31234 RepID=A0A6A5HQS8_CAERE|nr:hypothetical protein GCK72_008114 [Caenorhabditis remanei]KAF1768152.1 hypothetical protein GCK72_008114 [Caenorhabditis remanei]